MTAKTEESYHSTSRERSIQTVTLPSGLRQEVGVPVTPCRGGSYDLMDVTLRDAGNTLNIIPCTHTVIQEQRKSH